MGKRYFICLNNNDNTPLGGVAMDIDYYKRVASGTFINYVVDQNFNHLFQELYQNIFLSKDNNPTAKFIGLKLLSVGHDIISLGLEDNFKIMLHRFITMRDFMPRFTFLQKFLYRVLTSPTLGKQVLDPFLHMFLPGNMVTQLYGSLTTSSKVVKALTAFIQTPNLHTAVRTYECTNKMYKEVFGKKSYNVPCKDGALQMFKIGVVAAALKLHLSSDTEYDVVKGINFRKLPDNPAYVNFMNDIGNMNLSISYAEAACYIIMFIGIHPTHFSKEDLDTILGYYVSPLLDKTLTASMETNRNLMDDTLLILRGLCGAKDFAKWTVLDSKIINLYSYPNYFDMFAQPFNPVIPVNPNASIPPLYPPQFATQPQWQQPFDQMKQQQPNQPMCRCYQCGNFQQIPMPGFNNA